MRVIFSSQSATKITFTCACLQAACGWPARPLTVPQSQTGRPSVSPIIMSAAAAPVAADGQLTLSAEQMQLQEPHTAQLDSRLLQLATTDSLQQQRMRRTRSCMTRSRLLWKSSIGAERSALQCPPACCLL